MTPTLPPDPDYRSGLSHHYHTVTTVTITTTTTASSLITDNWYSNDSLLAALSLASDGVVQAFTLTPTPNTLVSTFHPDGSSQKVFLLPIPIRSRQSKSPLHLFGKIGLAKFAPFLKIVFIHLLTMRLRSDTCCSSPLRYDCCTNE